MNIVTADAFANAAGVCRGQLSVYDTFRTLELNESERERFVDERSRYGCGQGSAEKMLSGRTTREEAPRPRLVVRDAR